MTSSVQAPSLDIATPERVALDLPIAGLGYRSMAYVVDALILFAGWISLFFLITLLHTNAVERFGALSGLSQTLLVVAAFGAQWLYWTCFEGLGGGRTPGKRLLRIRVVRDDGSPIGVFEAAVRTLSRLIDFLPSAYGVGVLAMLFSRQHRRVGDWLAGTVVIRDQAADLERYALSEPGQSLSLAVSAIPPSELDMLLGFLDRAPHLEPSHREALSLRMLARFCPTLDAPARTRIAASWEETESVLRAMLKGLT
jgi:uncharacterized RDD family membrane protein YckC